MIAYLCIYVNKKHPETEVFFLFHTGRVRFWSRWHATGTTYDLIRRSIKPFVEPREISISHLTGIVKDKFISIYRFCHHNTNKLISWTLSVNLKKYDISVPAFIIRNAHRTLLKSQIVLSGCEESKSIVCYAAFRAEKYTSTRCLMASVRPYP